eukprot:SAG22_NODE_3320_length_1780_cov_2.687686_2_plen_25_part_01
MYTQITQTEIKNDVVTKFCSLNFLN